MLIDLTEDERLGLIEAVERGLNDREDYMCYGNPSSDFGDEWPENAKEQGRRWRHAAQAMRKFGSGSVWPDPPPDGGGPC